MKTRTLVVAIAACAALAAVAQAPTIKRTLLQRIDVSETREAVLGAAEIPEGGTTGRHTHPGVETGYVLEGTLMLAIDGEPARTLKAGDSYKIPEGRVHNANAQGGPVRVLATYVVDKGKPLATPAP
jgi:quercetin dioxygenase-like cupin family protein